MKINKEELRNIILEEITNEMETSTAAIQKGMRGQQMQKSVSAAGGGGRETIARLQRIISTIGQQKMSQVPAPVKIALQKLEAALGIQSDAGTAQQGDAQ